MDHLQFSPFFNGGRRDGGITLNGLEGIKKLKKVAMKVAKPKTLLKVAAVASSASNVYATGGKAALKAAAKKSATKAVNKKLAKYGGEITPAVAVRAEQEADRMADEAADATQQGFLDYAAQNHPQEYADAYDAAQTLEGLGETDTSLADKIQSVFSATAPAVVNLYSQYQLQQINVKRAKQGLPPLKADEYGNAVKVEAEAGPETRASIRSGVVEGIGNYMLPLIGLGVLGLIVFRPANRRR